MQKYSTSSSYQYLQSETPSRKFKKSVVAKTNGTRRTFKPNFDLKSVKSWDQFTHILPPTGRKKMIKDLSPPTSARSPTDTEEASILHRPRSRRSLVEFAQQKLRRSSISNSRISVTVLEEGNRIVSNLVVEALGREDLERVFTCRVSNTDLLPAIQERAKLDMIRE